MGRLKALVLQAGLWIGVVVWALGAEAWAATQVYFTSQDNVESKIVELINQSHFTIHMALFRFTSRPLAQALKSAQNRGVRIRIVLDGHEGSARPPGEVRRLEGKNDGHGVMHHKFALFDEAQAVTGSFNWTPSAEYKNYENALLTDDPKVTRAYKKEFETLWARAKDVPPGALDPAPISKMKRSAAHEKHFHRVTHYPIIRKGSHGRHKKSGK